ncbi:hypothetical protein [Myxococcus virescens]|uniref:hypothetical protein n=1 Tax=Myxococcus virescens TaxID=83456 RepID=UPI001FC9232D|nr:hypothetical protein [Myxococcus virescens]
MTATRDLLAPLDRRDQRVRPGLLARRVPPVQRALLVPPAQRALLVKLVPPAQRALLVKLVPPAQRALLVKLVPPAQRALLVKLVPPAQRALLVKLVPPAQRALLVPPERRGLQDSPWSVHPSRPGRTAPMAAFGTPLRRGSTTSVTGHRDLPVTPWPSDTSMP